MRSGADQKPLASEDGNADGSEKLKPFVIGKAGNPRCFKNFNVGVYCEYVHNKKAWTSVIFSDWLKKFNSKMKRQKSASASYNG